MRRSVVFSMVVMVVIVSLCLTGPPCLAGKRIYTMSGEVVAIDRATNTVVVEVPMGDRVFTVGGALSPQALLKRGGHPAGLEDFHRGDRVTVTWEAAEDGHLILSLTAD